MSDEPRQSFIRTHFSLLITAVIFSVSGTLSAQTGLSPQDVIQGATTYAPGLVVSTAARKASGAGPETPPPPVAPPSVVTVSSQQVLAEMRERRIIDKGVETWTADDKDILERARLAENMGAFDFLREARGRRLRGLIVIRKEPGEGRRPLLTKAGFQEYIFIKSQKARTFFEKRTDAKFVFGVTTMDGKKIFDNRGLLSADGDFLFNQILGGSIVKWKEPNGTERSNAARKP